MPPCTHYKAVPIGKQQEAEIKVHSYSGWTTSRTDIMGSDWKQTFTDLSGTEVRNNGWIYNRTSIYHSALSRPSPSIVQGSTRQRRKGNAVFPCMWLDFFPKHIVGCCSPSNEFKHALKHSGASLLYSVSLHHKHININTNKEKQLSSQLSYTAILGKALSSIDTINFRLLQCKSIGLKASILKSTGVILNMSHLIFWIESYPSCPGW